MQKSDIISKIKISKNSGRDDEFLFYSGVLSLIEKQAQKAEHYFHKVIKFSKNKKLIQNSYHNLLSMYFKEKNFNKARQLLESNKSINNYRAYLIVSYIQQFSTAISLIGTIAFVFMIFTPGFIYSLFFLLCILLVFSYINLANYRIRIYHKIFVFPLFIITFFVISRIFWSS